MTWRECANPECGEPVRVLRRGRCEACYRYLRRTGRDRSEAMVVRANVRYLERLYLRRSHV